MDFFQYYGKHARLYCEFLAVYFDLATNGFVKNNNSIFLLFQWLKEATNRAIV